MQAKEEAKLEEALDAMDGRREGDASRVRTQSGTVKDGKSPGVVVSRKDDIWIVEILAMESVRWAPESHIVIRLADGTDLHATLVAEGTTRSGEILPRTRIRLVLRLSGPGTADPTLATQVGMKLNTFLQNVTRARKLLAQCLKKRGIDLDAELA